MIHFVSLDLASAVARFEVNLSWAEWSTSCHLVRGVFLSWFSARNLQQAPLRDTKTPSKIQFTYSCQGIWNTANFMNIKYCCFKHQLNSYYILGNVLSTCEYLVYLAISNTVSPAIIFQRWQAVNPEMLSRSNISLNSLKYCK